MGILKTLVGTDTGQLFTVDTIKFQGGLWLVAKWYEPTSTRGRMPKRIIRLDTLPHKEVPNGKPAHILLQCPMPMSVLDGPGIPAPDSGFVVLEFVDTGKPTVTQH